MSTAAQNLEDAMKYLHDASHLTGNAADVLEHVSRPMCEQAIDAMGMIEDIRDRAKRVADALESA